MNTASLLTSMDYAAVAFFFAAWLGYHWVVEMSPASPRSLNNLMNRQRHLWMQEMYRRDLRMIDTALLSSLQAGTSFFASTSLLAVGGSLALLRSTDSLDQIMADLPLGAATSRGMWEIKVVGLAIIFVYAFFKFAWSYRVFNYAAILMGAVPMHKYEEPRAEVAVHKAGLMTVAAGRHFNRGQRAFFFALAYLGWFIGPVVMMIATAAVLAALWRRQFNSDAWRAAAHDSA